MGVERRLLTLKEAGEALGMKEATLRKWVLQRRISYHKLGKSVRVSTEVVDRLIQDSNRSAVVGGAR